MSSWRRASIGCAAALLGLLAGACAAAPAAAPPGAVLIVDRRDPTCSDRPASAVGPFCTITAAATLVRPGQTVLVRPGTYQEEVELTVSGTAERPIAILADPSGTVRITGRRSGMRLLSLSYVSVEGFTIDTTFESGVDVNACDHVSVVGMTIDRAGSRDVARVADGIAVVASRNVSIVGNDVSRSNRTGLFLDATTSETTVERNLLVANGAGLTRAGVGIDVRGDKNLLRHNVGHDNDDSGAQFHEGATDNVVTGNLFYDNRDHGIDVANSPRQHIVGNTLVGNFSSGINVEGTASQGTTIANNIAVDNNVSASLDAANIRVTAPAVPGTSADHDLVRRGPSGALYIWSSRGFGDLAGVRSSGQEASGLDSDPRFADRAAFALLPASPGIDAGNADVVGHALVDRYGRPRVGAPDLGALEASPGPPAPRLVRTVPTPKGPSWCGAGRCRPSEHPTRSSWMASRPSQRPRVPRAPCSLRHRRAPSPSGRSSTAWPANRGRQRPPTSDQRSIEADGTPAPCRTET